MALKMSKTHSIAELLDKGLLFSGSSSKISSKKKTCNLLAHNTNVPLTIQIINNLLPCGELKKSVLHEWSLQTAELSPLSSTRSTNSSFWNPPLILITHLLSLLLRQDTRIETKFIFWIGRHIWPMPNILEQVFKDVFSWETQCLFIDTNKSKAQHTLWSSIQALQSSATAAVIIDAQGFSLKATRRLLLAAQKSSAFCFLLRPPWEINRPSCAQTKWLLTPLPATTDFIKWKLSLLRAHGLTAPCSWEIEWNFVRACFFKEAEKENDKIYESPLHIFSCIFNGSTETAANQQTKDKSSNAA